MMRDALLLLPNQLWKENPLLEKNLLVVFVEHPRFFSEFTYHKQKLVFHRACMRAFFFELQKKGCHCLYLEWKRIPNTQALFKEIQKLKIQTLHLIAPTDAPLEKEFRKVAKAQKCHLQIHEPMGFLTPPSWGIAFFKGKKHYSMSAFYLAQRKRLSLLIKDNKPEGGKWSFDAENRKKIPSNLSIPALIKIKRNRYVEEAKHYVEQHFSHHPGSLESFIYPINHQGAQSWLDDFISKRLKQFGPYEDAICSDAPFLFHSLLSPLLNSGLLTPELVLERVLKARQLHKIPINSLEGFIRQLVGWREFVRIVYLIEGEKLRKSNFFKHHKPLPESFWTGKTHITPLDIVLKRVFQFAYCHHIERLMILGNFLLLSEISPNAIYQWFMQMFIDAYDWVMVPNIYGMSQFADGGSLTTKPYISASNYIKKMSNIKTGAWTQIWDGLYWLFLKKQEKRLHNNPRLAITMNLLRKKSKKSFQSYQEITTNFARQNL